MTMSASETALLLQTLQNIEQHLASLAASARELSRVNLQIAASPVR
jgi:hypothetical protein